MNAMAEKLIVLRSRVFRAAVKKFKRFDCPVDRNIWAISLMYRWDCWVKRTYFLVGRK